ncbi:MAG TPA: cyclic nucleotide-binding domain-containing protein [Candidatus Limnocylindrales bacterium]
MTTAPVRPADLATFTLFHDLPTVDLARLSRVASRRRLADGETLFDQGGAAASMFALATGRLALRATIRGRSVIVQTIGDGEVLGWSALREDARWLTTGRAIGDVELIEVPADAMLDLLASGSVHARLLIRRLFGIAADHLDTMQAQLKALGTEGVITGG